MTYLLVTDDNPDITITFEIYDTDNGNRLVDISLHDDYSYDNNWTHTFTVEQAREKWNRYIERGYYQVTISDI